ncbi:MAG TPA: tetratricopeptide repeat protein, partial [Chthoniobacterales bacterium]|nr:tetratricopeptide repeat protein [Chthoniobacterales bacterium]
MSDSFAIRWVAFCRKEWPRFLFLAIIGFLTRLPALTGQLLWDDAYLARDNPFIKSPLLTLEAFRHYLFLDSISGHYRPVQNLSFMVDYYFWNTDPAGFHLTNILLHVACGLLLYQLLRTLFQRAMAAPENASDAFSWSKSLGPFLVAALWMVHPVHSAAVDYISGRADSLAFLFASGAWLLVIRAHAVRSRWLKIVLFLVAAFSGLLSLCSREIACVWIFIFLVHTLAFEKRLGVRTKIVTVLCCALLIGAYAGLHSLAHGRPTVATEPQPAVVRVTLMLRALGDYGRLMLFPANLHMERTLLDPAIFRDRDAWRAGANWEYLSVLGALVTAGFAFGCFKRGAGQRLRIIGTLWFMAGYLPVSNLVQLNATVAEHWLYLPSVGFLIFLAGCTLDTPRRWRRAFTAVAFVAIVALSVRSWIRSTDWQDEETFYKRTLAAGGFGPRVVVNLALIYARQNRFAEAEKMLRPIVSAAPDYPNARNTLASVLAHEGKTTEAEALFSGSVEQASKARKDYPRTWLAASNLARIHAAAQDNAGAIALLERARADYPQVWDLISFESELVRRTQGPQPALRLVEEFVRENWWHHAATLAEGKLYAENNESERALQALHRAALLD